jgi:hypothetical protein
VKNSNEIELPELNIERDPLFLIIYAACSLALGYFTYHLFVIINPWAFILMVPTVVALFQLVWFILNPFARVFKDRVEIKRTLFSNKQWYYLDLSKAMADKKNRVYITYSDGEIERLNLFGIKKEHVELFVKSLNNKGEVKP